MRFIQSDAHPFILRLRLIKFKILLNIIFCESQLLVSSNMCVLFLCLPFLPLWCNVHWLSRCHGKVNSEKARLQYLDCFTRPSHVLQNHPLRPGCYYFHKARKNVKLMEKLSVGLVCNHGHGQIVFRASMDLITNLQTALFSFCSLGKIDCVLKSSPFFTKGVLIIILYSWTASVCCSHL